MMQNFIRNLKAVAVWYAQSIGVTVALMAGLWLFGAIMSLIGGDKVWNPFHAKYELFVWLCLFVIFSKCVFFVCIFRVFKVPEAYPPRKEEEESFLQMFLGWLLMVAIIIAHIVEAVQWWDPDGVQRQRWTIKQKS